MCHHTSPHKSQSGFFFAYRSHFSKHCLFPVLFSRVPMDHELFRGPLTCSLFFSVWGVDAPSIGGWDKTIFLIIYALSAPQFSLQNLIISYDLYNLIPILCLTLIISIIISILYYLLLLLLLLLLLFMDPIILCLTQVLLFPASGFGLRSVWLCASGSLPRSAQIGTFEVPVLAAFPDGSYACSEYNFTKFRLQNADVCRCMQ